MLEQSQTFGKAQSFYDEYTRKGSEIESTHYCPGCGHGTIQKLIAEAMDDLGIQDRTIFLSPVGCAVFSYYYFDTGNIQCSHGRAPAVGTGVKRTVKDAIVVSYQGDGDLAGIGMTEIIHAANRGEPITVFFINNAIYGMTGGQMAPTTLLGQKTQTSPFGRQFERDGLPIKMVELINALVAPVYIERCSVASSKDIIKTRRAIHKALQTQMDGIGFSFVEILSPCPTNWGMSAVDSRTWMTEEMTQYFPLGMVRDNIHKPAVQSTEEVLPWFDDTQLTALLTSSGTVPVTQKRSTRGTWKVKIAGFGGQGVLSAGELLATCGMGEGLHVSWLPSYGPEMRGGSANVSVILSDEAIGSPLVDHPQVLLAFNEPSLDLFEPQMEPGACIIVNSSIIKRQVERTDVAVFYIPASDIAKDAGLLSAANVVMITAYLLVSKSLALETLIRCIPLVLRKKDFLETNMAIVRETEAYVAAHSMGKG